MSYLLRENMHFVTLEKVLPPVFAWLQDPICLYGPTYYDRARHTNTKNPMIFVETDAMFQGGFFE